MAPAPTAAVAKRTCVPSTVVSSIGTTVSQPAGMTAPVMMRMHCPAGTGVPTGAPARAVGATTASAASGAPASSDAAAKA